MNKKVKIKLAQHEIHDLIWLMTVEAKHKFCSKARMNLIIHPFQKIYGRLESNKWNKWYTMSLHTTEAATLYTVLFPVNTPSGSSTWNTQRRVLDAIDKVHAYSTSETKLYEKE